MHESHEGIERYLAVGRVAVLQTEPQRRDGPRFSTSFIGWRRGRAIFIEHPRTAEGRDVAFRDAQPCVVRFVHEGQACAFTSDVLDWGAGRGDTQVRLRWPSQMERLSLRRHDRVLVSVACRVVLPEGKSIEGELHDLSMSGCGFAAAVVASKGDALQVSFRLPDGASIENLQVNVRMVRPTLDGCFLGCEFEPGQERLQNDISIYVTSELARARRASVMEQPRVLIVDAQVEFAEKLKRMLGRHGIDALSACSTLDAMHAIRSLPLQLVLINQAMPELSGTEICRLIRAARGLEKLPLLVYGGKAEDGIAALAHGAQRYLPAGNGLMAELTYEAKRALQMLAGGDAS